MKFVQRATLVTVLAGLFSLFAMDLGAGKRSPISPVSELTALGGGEGAAEAHREGFAPADNVDDARREIRTFGQKSSESEAIADSDEELSKKIL